MTGPDREAQRDAIVDAAARWAGAREVIDQYYDDPTITDAEVARHETWLRDTAGRQLLEAVNAYLDGIHSRAGGGR